MVRRCAISRRTSSGTDATAALELIAPAGKGIVLRELSVYLAAATASAYGLGRPAAKGITPTTPVSLLLESGDSGLILTSTAIAWGTGPTVPGGFLRRVAFPATISSHVIWTFHGLEIPAGTSLVLWNLGTNGVVDVNVMVEE